MKDHKIWNSDFGKVFIDRHNKEVGVDIEKEFQLGRGGQAIDTMINGPINKDFDGMIKGDKNICPNCGDKLAIKSFCKKCRKEII